MGSDHGTVEDQPLEVGVLQGLEDPEPDPLGGPSIEPLPHQVPLAEAFREVTPGGAGLADPEHGIDEETIVRGGHAGVAGPAGEEVLDPLPVFICYRVAIHDACSTGSESFKRLPVLRKSPRYCPHGLGCSRQIDRISLRLFQEFARAPGIPAQSGRWEGKKDQGRPDRQRPGCPPEGLRSFPARTPFRSIILGDDPMRFSWKKPASPRIDTSRAGTTRRPKRIALSWDNLEERVVLSHGGGLAHLHAAQVASSSSTSSSSSTLFDGASDASDRHPDDPGRLGDDGWRADDAPFGVPDAPGRRAQTQQRLGPVNLRGQPGDDLRGQPDCLDARR